MKMVLRLLTSKTDIKVQVSKNVAKYYTFTDKPSDNNIAYRIELDNDVSRTRRSLFN